MKSIEERQSDLEQEMAVMRELLEHNLINDANFQKEIRGILDYNKERNLKVDMFIESEMDIRKEKAEFWKGLRDKLATAGVLGVLGLLGSVLWYAFTQFINHTPK